MNRPTFRCSELDRLLNCHGSATLVPLVAPRDGDEGTEGTGLHTGIAVKLFAELGATCPQLDFVQAFTHNQWIVDYCFREVRDNVPKDWSLEVEAPLAYDFGAFNLSGHIDCHAVNPDQTEAIGWDWKTGYRPVDPADFNWQVVGYIAVLKRAYPKLRKITFKIVQPRNSEDDGFQRISTVVVEDLPVAGMPGQFAPMIDGMIRNFVARVEAAIADAMTVSSGIHQCAWCPAARLDVCPAFTKLIEHMKAALTPEFLATVRREPSDAALAEMVIAGKILERPISDATDLLKERLSAVGTIQANGVAISMKESGGAYKVLDPVGMLTGLLDLAPPEKLAPALSYPVGRIKDTLAEVLDIPKTSKMGTSAEGVFAARFGPLVEQSKRRTLIFQ